MAEQEEPVHLDTVDARAGSKSRRTRYILGMSLALVIVVFAILYFRAAG